jgi:hypothetical protein
MKTGEYAVAVVGLIADASCRHSQTRGPTRSGSCAASMPHIVSATRQTDAQVGAQLQPAQINLYATGELHRIL